MRYVKIFTLIVLLNCNYVLGSSDKGKEEVSPEEQATEILFEQLNKPEIDLEMIDFALDNGADVNAVDADRFPVMYRVLLTENTAVLQRILSANPDLTRVYAPGRNVISVLLRSSDDMIRVFLNHINGIFEEELILIINHIFQTNHEEMERLINLFFNAPPKISNTLLSTIFWESLDQKRMDVYRVLLSLLKKDNVSSPDYHWFISVFCDWIIKKIADCKDEKLCKKELISFFPQVVNAFVENNRGSPAFEIIRDRLSSTISGPKFLNLKLPKSKGSTVIKHSWMEKHQRRFIKFLKNCGLYYSDFLNAVFKNEKFLKASCEDFYKLASLLNILSQWKNEDFLSSHNEAPELLPLLHHFEDPKYIYLILHFFVRNPAYISFLYNGEPFMITFLRVMNGWSEIDADSCILIWECFWHALDSGKFTLEELLKDSTYNLRGMLLRGAIGGEKPFKSVSLLRRSTMNDRKAFIIDLLEYEERQRKVNANYEALNSNSLEGLERFSSSILVEVYLRQALQNFFRIREIVDERFHQMAFNSYLQWLPEGVVLRDVLSFVRKDESQFLNSLLKRIFPLIFPHSFIFPRHVSSCTLL